MTDVRTARLSLHPVTAAEAQQILAGAADAWADDYPFDGDLAALGAGGQPPFGYYQIRRLDDGLAIGGIGFKGPPSDGVAEVGYGLAPSARGHGYATEALLALMDVAARLGVSILRADTDPDNIASQRTLLKAGFTTAAEPYHYEARITPANSST